eukprot:13211096-Alexandrium_andersonii.AAC.1
MELGPVSMAELRAALAAAKAGRRGGPSGMIVEELKLLGDDDLDGLRVFFSRCLETASFPSQRRRAKVAGVFKKGPRRLADNFRPISLLEVAYKLFARALAARLQRALLETLRPAQF